MPGLSNEQQAAARTEYEANNLQRALGGLIGTKLLETNTTNDINNFINYVKTNPRIQSERQFLLGVCENLRTLANAYGNIINKLDNNAPDVYVSQDDLQSYLPNIELDIKSLTETRDSLINNRDTAELRNTILRSGNGAVTNHQIYLLGRPLRPASIPLLWALSTLFVGFALLIFYTFYPYKSPDIEVVLFDLYLLFADPFTWAILFSIASIVILFLSLQIAGIL
jgi:hypothetical protein